MGKIANLNALTKGTNRRQPTLTIFRFSAGGAPNRGVPKVSTPGAFIGLVSGWGCLEWVTAVSGALPVVER